MSQKGTPIDDLGELKSQFLASLNHEIRTPLTGIMGMLDLLLETPLTDEQKEFADSSRICAGNLLDIMNSTLEYSALAANQVKLEELEFTLRELLDGLMDEYSGKAKRKGIAFVSEVADSVPGIVIGDALRMRRMLGNLLENAIKFTPRGEIEVSAASIVLTNGDVLLNVSVRDTGVGIPADQLNTIFDSFRQLDKGLARRFTGMGLGLSVTQKLAKLMRAELLVSSEFGKGSTFSIHIPLRIPGEWEGRALGIRFAF